MDESAILRATIADLRGQLASVIECNDRQCKLIRDLQDKSLYGDVKANSPFAAILAEMQAMHDKKSKDYGTGEDPLANVRASEKFGIPAWLGAQVRLHDKIVRIQSFAKKGNLANESLEDSLIDICVYGVISLQLYREGKTNDTPR